MTNDAPAQASVEAIARIIDPEAFDGFDAEYARTKGVTSASMGFAVRMNKARDKARQIAALSPPPTVGAEDAAVAWHCIGSGDGWSEDKIIRHRGTAEEYARRPEQWNVRAPVYAPRPAPAADGQRVKVKGLEWKPYGHSTFVASDLYQVVDNGKNWPTERFWLRIARGDWRRFDTLVQACAAAQADFEQRIRAALATDKEG